MKKHLARLLNLFFQALNIIFATITIALVIIAIFRPSLVKVFLAWLWEIIIHLWNWNYLIAFASATIESFPVIWVLVPWMQVMLMVGGFFGKHNLYGVIMVAMVWAIIGNYFWYYLWERYGDGFFKKYWDWFWVGKTELRILKKQIEKNWPWFIILGKFHNFTRAFVPFIAWSMWMHKKNFWTFNIIGSIIWAITIITLWVAFANYYKMAVDYLPYILLGVFELFWIYVYLFKRKEFMQYIKEKNEEIDEKINNSDKKK